MPTSSSGYSNGIKKYKLTNTASTVKNGEIYLAQRGSISASGDYGWRPYTSAFVVELTGASKITINVKSNTTSARTITGQVYTMAEPFYNIYKNTAIGSSLEDYVIALNKKTTKTDEESAIVNIAAFKAITSSKDANKKLLIGESEEIANASTKYGGAISHNCPKTKGGTNSFDVEIETSGKYLIYLTSSGSSVGITSIVFTPSAPATKYSVTYDANGGGTIPTQEDVAEGTEITLAAAPTAPAGKEFAGWKCSVDDATYAAGVEYTMTAEATIFTAQWQAETTKYAVTYDLNGSPATAPTQPSVAEGTTITLAEAPTWEGYRFDGWLVKDENGNDVTITDGKFTMPAAKVTITAQWVKVWTVTFNTNGGSTIEPVVVDNNGTLTAPTAPKKDCYAFVEWQKDGVAFDFATTITSDITLTAVWTPKYATSLDFAAITTDGTTGDNPIVDFLASGNMIASNLGSSEWETSTSKSGYVGYKLKNTGATITFLVQGGKRVMITFGSIGANVTLKKGEESVTISAASGDNAETVYPAFDVATDMLITLTTTSGSTVTLKSITIGEIPDISDDATLKDLKVDGTTIAEFNSATDSYYVEMPYGTQKADLPPVTATANHAAATVIVQDAKDRPDDTRATIKVTAEDGTTKHYYVYFTNAAKEGVNLVKATIGDKSITLVANESYIKSAIVENNGVNGRDGGVSAGSKFQKNSYIKIEMPAGQQFKAKDIVDLEVTAIGGTYKLLVYSENSTAAEKLVVDETTAPVLVVGHNKVQLNKDAQALYLVRDGSNNWNPHVASILVQRYMAPFIESFVIGEAEGTIDQENKTIAVEVSASTDVAALTPTIVAWANGGATVTPTGAQDFTNPVVYSVASAYAEDRTTEYTVTVTKAAAIKEVVISGTLSVLEDETTTLSATVIDTNDAEASNQNVTWTSNDETTAIVDANGVVTGVKAGTVTITATSVEDNTKSASVTITVAVNPCRTWKNPADYTTTCVVGKLQLKPVGLGTLQENMTPYQGATKTNAWKLDAKNTKYAEISFIDKAQFDGFTVGVSSNGENKNYKFAVVCSQGIGEDFDKGIIEGKTYDAVDNNEPENLINVELPEGTRAVRVYRQYEQGEVDLGGGSSVFLYYVNACKKDFVPLTLVSLADANLAVGGTLAQKVVVNPANADIQTTTWSIESTTATGVTIDAATGVLTAAADATEGTVSVKVQVTDILGNTQEATATITIITEYTQANITESITWDWTVAAMNEVGTENGNTEYLMANVSSAVPNNENFRSDMLLITAQYANRGASNQFFQGTKIRFNTTIDGLVRVYYRSTGSGKNVEITINGISAGSGDAFQWSNYIEVPAGEVTIVGTGIGENATGLTRIQKIEFLALGHRREASWIVPNELGTVCLKDACIIKGAELYELQGPDENRKLVFDEILSGELEAGKPYLFNATATGRISFYNKVKAAHTETAGSLKGMYGTFEDIKFYPATDQNIYYFSGHSIWAVKKNTANVELPAYLCYVKMDEFLASPVPDANPAPGRRRVTLGVNGQQVATGVDQVQGDEAPTKMIINGQLFILRGEKMYDAQGKLVK